MRIAVLLSVLLMAMLPAAMAQDEGMERVPASEESFPIIGWPSGDAAAGLAAFESLKCNACHCVPSIPDLAAGGGIGPDLIAEEYARPRLALLRQIVVPGSDRPEQISHMGNFAEVMTVQQLTDLIAFIEGIDATGK